MKSEKVLEIEGLSITYESVNGKVNALEDISLEIKPSEFVAIVGESGSGKSTLALSIIGLLPKSAIIRGDIVYKSVNLAGLKKKEWPKYRGLEIGMIFQEPMTSLNPIEKVNKQLEETVNIAESKKKSPGPEENADVGGSDRGPTLEKKLVHKHVIEWLRRVRIADPESVAERFPFQLSGGMVQRVMIAMALSLHPSLLLADEPTTALDVTTQAQILKLMKSLVSEAQTSILLITHDLGVAAQVADRIVVLYAGEIVEDGTVEQIFSNPLHPYTKGLLKCYPKSASTKERLETLAGSVPDLRAEIKGCKFADRCPYVTERCREESPHYIQVESNHHAKCTLYY